MTTPPDEIPLDDAANFPIKRRQALLRGIKDTRKKMELVKEQIDDELRKVRMTWMNESRTT